VGRLVVAVGLLTSLTALAAEEPRARLSYGREAGAERCPDEHAVRSAVAARLGYDPFDTVGDARKTITVVLTAAPRGQAPGLIARLVLTDGNGDIGGRRELKARGSDCTALADAVVLAISLAIDPLRFVEGPPPPETRPPPAPVAATAEPSRPSGPAPLPTYRGRLGAGAHAALGSAPGVSFGFTVTGGIRARRWSLNLEVRADIPATENVLGGGTVTTAIYVAGIAPCFHASVFAGCGLLVAGAQIARGEFATTADATVPYVAAGLRTALEFPLARKLELQVRADLLATITLGVFNVLGMAEPAYRNGPVSGALHVAMLGYFK
jgi:hypothetical protein